MRMCFDVYVCNRKVQRSGHRKLNTERYRRSACCQFVAVLLIKCFRLAPLLLSKCYPIAAVLLSECSHLATVLLSVCYRERAYAFMLPVGCATLSTKEPGGWRDAAIRSWG
jgi:hypothetical protein